jgi:hypothetical protein
MKDAWDGSIFEGDAKQMKAAGVAKFRPEIFEHTCEAKRKGGDDCVVFTLMSIP